jgi:hypothetical protein
MGRSAILRWGGFTSLGGGGFISSGGAASSRRAGVAAPPRAQYARAAAPPRARRHLLPPLLLGWLAWRCHAHAWGRRSSWIHFLVTGDGGAGVFWVPRLMKFLAGRIYIDKTATVRRPVRASEPVSAKESSWPQKESCGHKETCDCSYFIQNTICPTTPMSFSILKKTMNCLYFFNF